MDIVYLIIGGLLLAAAGLAIWERKRGRRFKIEDSSHDAGSHASREATRITDEVRNRTMFGGDHHQ